MPKFIPGLALCEGFYHEAVKPVLDAVFPNLRYTAALIGSGSEVLGFDTPMSTDHHWGPRLMLFLRPEDITQQDAIHATLRHRLPHTFRGYPTNFAPPDPNDKGTQLLAETTSGPVNHRVEAYTLHSFFQSYLGFDLDAELTPADWLSFPQQKLRTITAGAVYHDDLGLDVLRAHFRYYPHDVWLYLLASGWARIGQEEHLMARAGYVGDELGSQVIAGRLVRDIMMLGFLMERQYAPYPKWFGTAFARLDCAPALLPHLRGALLAETWPERERGLAAAYEELARRHNALGITEPLPEQVSSFWGRPFQVIHAERFADALRAAIQDEAVRRLPADIGGIDQFSDSTDLRENAGLRGRIAGLYG
ncbi:MAG: DUF4037 domain-containing protein [Anaerolineaceae bacterium]|nr:DUF4037 domain-containing protein [Anaerolineaceae bacterium]